MRQRCCCSCKVTLPSVDEFINVTKVDDWPGIASPNPLGIDPYARGWSVCSAGSCILQSEPTATCGANDGTMGVCYTQNFDGTLLGSNPNAIPGGIKACSAGGGEMVSEIADNCYKKSGSKVNFSHNCNPGWKAVLSKAVWPGRYGFLENDQNLSCCNTASAQSRKFTSIATRIQISATENSSRDLDLADGCGGCVGGSGSKTYSDSCDWNQTASVDAYGNLSRSGYKTFTVGGSNTGYELIDSGGCLVTQPNSSANYSGCDNCFEYTGSAVNRCGLPSTDFNFYRNSQASVTASDAAFLDMLANAYVSCDGQIHMVNRATGVHIDGDAATVESDLSTYGTVTVTLSNTNLSISISGSANNPSSYSGCPSGTGTDSLTASWTVNLTMALSGSITWAEVMDDGIALLDQWRLNDDAQYPWRNDSKKWLVPVVYRDANATFPSIDWTADSSCHFTSDSSYTGRIIGAPLPNGYGRHFNFNQINYTICDNGFGVCTYCAADLGQTSPTELPKTATAWTNYLDGIASYGEGGHVTQIIETVNGLAPIEGVYMQKWVERYKPWPSIRFFRPCDSDRWKMAMDASSCVSAEDTGTKTLTIPDDLTAKISAGDLVVFYGGGSYQNQVWSVASIDSGHIVLDTQLTDVPTAFISDVISEWAQSTNASQWGSYGVVGRLRWQSGGKPAPRAICGRLRATGTDDNPSTVTVSKATQLYTGDKVDFLDATGTAIVGLTNLTWTRLTDTTGTVPANAKDAVYIRSYEASPVDPSWNTDESRNTVVVQESYSQYREADADPMTPPSVMTETQITVDYASRYPYVLAVTPNAADTFTHGTVYSWDNTVISPDQCFGKEWHLGFQQAIADPFWEAPRAACSGSISMEAYPCALGTDTYKYNPLVEPLLSLPSGAPSLPSDVTLHTTGTMPVALGHPTCTAEPNGQTIPMDIRTEWEACNDWQAMTQHK